MSCPPPSVSSYACITCLQQQSTEQRLEGEEPDRPKRTKEEPQNQKEKQKGLGANPGHKQSQNSQFFTVYVFLNLSTLFDNFRAGQKTSKSVKTFFDTFRLFSRGAIFPALFANGGL